MRLERVSFDAVITDSKGQTLDVDCRVSEPAAAGAPALISIEIPLGAQPHVKLENPCHLKGRASRSEIEIDELWYRRLLCGGTSRKLARDSMEINHIGQLRVKTDFSIGHDAEIIFHLSPVEYLKHHSAASLLDYSRTPEMLVELFKLNVPELGDVSFIKQWSIRSAARGNISAEICSGFAARVARQTGELQDISQIVEKFRGVLTVLSVLFRQAVTLHGWDCIGPSGVETTWIYPLEPNLAPPMALEPRTDLTLEYEFQDCAQSLVKKYFEVEDNIRKAINLLSVAVAPHVKRSTGGNFLAMFSALEEAIALTKLSASEKAVLGQTNAELIRYLTELQATLDQEKPPNYDVLRKRIGGFIDSVSSSGPSFSVRFEKFVSEYSPLRFHMADLWPVFGSSKLPGLKQIRDSLAHGLRQKYNAQILNVSSWHFSILVERLVFIVLAIPVPKGIDRDSILLSREEWYNRSYWTRLQGCNSHT